MNKVLFIILLLVLIFNHIKAEPVLDVCIQEVDMSSYPVIKLYGVVFNLYAKSLVDSENISINEGRKEGVNVVYKVLGGGKDYQAFCIQYDSSWDTNKGREFFIRIQVNGLCNKPKSFYIEPEKVMVASGEKDARLRYRTKRIFQDLDIFKNKKLNTVKVLEQKYYKDTTLCHINDDNIEDYTFLESVNCWPYSVYELTIGVSIDSLTHKEYSKLIDFYEDAVTNVRLEAWGDIITQSVSHDIRANYYTCSIFKYFKDIDNWCYYGSYNEEFYTESNSSFLMGAELYSSNKSIPLGDSISVELPDLKDSIVQIFNCDYEIYLSEYKTKKYNKTTIQDMYQTLDYLNYVEINKSTVQKYNDIGFFLLEAGNCQQAVYILENVVHRFPTRTVTYLNLGDAYYCNGNSKEAIEMYEKYIELMKSNGKEAKIPKRVFDRIE